MDSFHTAVCLASKGNINKDEFVLLQSGINKIKGHIHSERFTEDRAIACACRCMYLVALVLSDSEIIPDVIAGKYDEGIMITHPSYKKLNNIRKINMDAFAYAHAAIDMLTEQKLI